MGKLDVIKHCKTQGHLDRAKSLKISNNSDCHRVHAIQIVIGFIFFNEISRDEGVNLHVFNKVSLQLWGYS